MANQWYYISHGVQQGPVSDAQLKKLVETGELTKESLIWKQGMTDWKKAVALKGLFPSSDPSMPPPIPSAVAGEKPEIPNSEHTPKTALSFGESAKLTGNLAAKQTELTKINQVSIPAQHVKIGQHVYDSKHEQSQHAELFAEIDRLNNSIQEVEEATKSHPQPNSISERAKSMASQTANAAKLKTYQMQRRLKLIALGKVIFESGKTPQSCSQQRTEIDTLLSRAGTLTEEIADIKGKLAEQGRGAAQAGRSLLRNSAIVVASSIFCAPIGLFLIWKHPKWEGPTKLKWAGVSLACFFGFMILGRLGGPTQNNEIASNDQGATSIAGIKVDGNPDDQNRITDSQSNLTKEKTSGSKAILLGTLEELGEKAYQNLPFAKVEQSRDIAPTPLTSEFAKSGTFQFRTIVPDAYASKSSQQREQATVLGYKERTEVKEIDLSFDFHKSEGEPKSMLEFLPKTTIAFPSLRLGAMPGDSWEWINTDHVGTKIVSRYVYRRCVKHSGVTCVCIEHYVFSQSKGMSPKSLDEVRWYAEGIGVVKQEQYLGLGQLFSTNHRINISKYDSVSGDGEAKSTNSSRSQGDDGIRKTSKAKYVPAKELTMEQFGEKLYLNANERREHNYEFLLTYSDYKFEDIFGQSDKTEEIPNELKVAESFRCKDGIVTIEVQYHGTGGWIYVPKHYIPQRYHRADE